MKILIVIFILSFSVTAFAGECTVHADDAGDVSGVSVKLEEGKAFPNSSSCEEFKKASADKYGNCSCPAKEELASDGGGESQCGDDKVAGKIGGEKKKKDEGGNAGAVEN